MQPEQEAGPESEQQHEPEQQPSGTEIRHNLRAKILESIQSDRRFIGCVDYGSASEGRDDDWSDLDLAFFVHDDAVDAINEDWEEWASQFGRPLLTFQGAMDHPWVVYDTEPVPLRADFAFHPKSNLDIILKWPNSPLSVEAMVLYDDTGGRLSKNVSQIVGQDLSPADLESTYDKVCGGFWYYLLRLEGRIHRGDLFAAAWQFNYIVMTHLCALLKIEHGELNRFRSSGSTSGIEKVITATQLRRLKRCVAGPHVAELRRCMLEAAQLGSEVCGAIEKRHGWEWPDELAERIIKLSDIKRTVE